MYCLSLPPALVVSAQQHWHGRYFRSRSFGSMCIWLPYFSFSLLLVLCMDHTCTKLKVLFGFPFLTMRMVIGCNARCVHCSSLISRTGKRRLFPWCCCWLRNRYVRYVKEKRTRAAHSPMLCEEKLLRAMWGVDVVSFVGVGGLLSSCFLTVQE